MTDLTELKKNDKMKDKLFNFLDSHRHNDETKEKPTHLSYGLFSGKYYLINENRKEFMKLYTKAINQNITDLSILETQKEYAPIIVDLDFEIPTEDYNGTRLYNDALIYKLISIYVKVINKYLIVPKDKYKISILEKRKPTEKEITFRDGLHIVFPELCVQTKIRHLIRYSVVKECNEIKLFEGYTQSAEKIIDKAVVSTNGWLLYGSRKPDGQVYTLKKIVDDECNVLYDHINGDLNNERLIDYFSLQSKSYQMKNATEMNDDNTDSDINVECETYGLNYNNNETSKFDIPVNKEDDVRKATRFCKMMSNKRADDYHDWIRIGLALHGIEKSLLPVWIDFSKKIPKKFKEGECEKVWKTMKSSCSSNGLTIRSLAYWAKQDDPKQYDLYIKEEFRNSIKKSLDSNNYYLAKSVHAKYSDRFVCSSIKNNLWWEFREHRWVRIDEGYTLKLELSEDFANEYNKEIADISLSMIKVGGFDREEMMNRREKMQKIVNNLMNNSFKRTLMDEAKALFYDPTFDRKLDENIHLIGFENGVYDLEQGKFRDGRPDDYITLCTRNSYQPWNANNPYHSKIMTFFSQILPNERVRKYFINALCTTIAGSNKEEKLYVLTGSGSNGKSLTMDLAYYALGDYFMSCPITIITRKRGTSNETSPEKVRMKGKRCGVFQETDDGEKINVGVMKEFTGNDKILVRDLFKGSNEMIEFKPQMKFFLTCNQLPAVPSNDDGTWRRLRVVDFGSKFTDNPTKPNEFMIDNKLKEKITLWGPAFASYLVHIYMTEYKDITYLKEPEEVLASTKQYKMENDFYTEYIMDRIGVTTNDKDTIGRESIWEDFKAWYKFNYENAKMPKKTEFTKFINKQFNEPVRGRYKNVVFNSNKEELPQNELDT